MKLQLRHDFHASIEDVTDTLLAPAYSVHLAANHSFFAAIELQSQRESERRVQRTMRYRARPFIARLGVFSLPADWFVWLEKSVFDRDSATLSFENEPVLASVRGKVVNRGTMHFREHQHEDGHIVTTRESSFEIDLHVAAVYRPLADVALLMIRRQLEGSLDEEAALLRRFLACSAQSVAA